MLRTSAFGSRADPQPGTTNSQKSRSGPRMLALNRFDIALADSRTDDLHDPVAQVGARMFFNSTGLVKIRMILSRPK